MAAVAFWDANRMQPTMKIAMTTEELMRPRLNPSDYLSWLLGRVYVSLRLII
jgi:hypothetical protein